MHHAVKQSKRQFKHIISALVHPCTCKQVTKDCFKAILILLTPNMFAHYTSCLVQEIQDMRNLAGGCIVVLKPGNLNKIEEKGL